MQQIVIAAILAGQAPDLAHVRELALAEKFEFVERTQAEWLSGANRFDGPGEGFFVGQSGDAIVAMCGLNRDPYLSHPGVGRLRHLYVAPQVRRMGVGRRLVSSCLDLAASTFDRVRVRTLEPGASRLYESMGFQRVAEPEATHSLDLSDWSPGTRPR